MKVRLQPNRLEIDILRERWRCARPFPHVVVDDLLAPDDFARVARALRAEPHRFERSELSELWCSESSFAEAALLELADALGSAEALEVVSCLTGRAVRSLGVRGNLFQRGCYLLPHIDDPSHEGRRVSCVFYGPVCCTGGELDLFAVEPSASGAIIPVVTASIAPTPNRLVLFAVDDDALHEVREVSAGLRPTISGWYHA